MIVRGDVVTLKVEIVKKLTVFQTRFRAAVDHHDCSFGVGMKKPNGLQPGGTILTKKRESLAGSEEWIHLTCVNLGIVLFWNCREVHAFQETE